MITSIKIAESYLKDYSFENKKEISNLSKINIFIGPNNSGKSRFMRNLFSEDVFDFLVDDLELDSIINYWNAFREHIENLFKQTGINSNKFNNAFLKNFQFDSYLSSREPNKISELRQILKKLQDFSSNDTNGFNYSSNSRPDLTNFASAIRSLAQQFLSYIETSIKDTYDENGYKKLYLPILRGLRPINSNVDFYATRTYNDYFQGSSVVQTNIQTGLNYYTNIKSKLLSTKDKRNTIKHFEDFIKKNFFPDKKEFTLIPKEDSDVLLIGFGDEDEDERHIYDLGDGIQAIIQLLYPIFSSIGEKALFFIEEPEINLHPGMQRVFLETLLSEEFKDMQFFMTTHSNHLLDLTLDDKNISVFAFSKNNKSKKFEVRNLVRDDKNILRDLGVRNSSIFLANCTIWVEGITDRKYIRKYLELYWKENKPQKIHLEDLHYSFVEYAGSNIVHWNFDKGNKDENIEAFRINNNIFLILDSDVDKKEIRPKEERHSNLKAILKDNLYITEGKEIENTLSIQIIKKVVIDYENVTPLDLKFKKPNKETTIAKSYNSDLDIEKPYYWKSNIGELIDSSLTDKKRKVDYAEGNTIRDKDAFCDKAIKHLENYNDLSPEAIDLCKRITEFIESSNK